MGKDPAFLFYPGDYIGGTMGMTFEEKGAYIELLMTQFNRGHLTDDMIGQVVGQLWDRIKDKFEQDKNGLWFNERLDIEKERRKNYVNSRLNNKLGINQYSKKSGHLTNDMETENKDINKDINIEFEKFCDLYDYNKNKPECEKLWNGTKKTKQKHIINDETRSLIMKRLPKYINNTNKSEDYPIRMEPHKYLFQERWNDEVVEINKKREFIGYLYQCPECKEYFIHDENLDFDCPECPKTERRNGLMLSDTLDLIKTLYKE